MAIPARESFPLLPENTALLMYLALTPFTIIFLYGIYARLRAVGIGSLLAELRSDLPHHLYRLIHYGLLQRKVKRSPFAGPMHVTILYGTIVLFIGTSLVFLDTDILKFFNVAILRGDFYVGYEFFLDLFGIVFLAGLVMAIVRRSVLKPEYLENRRLYYGILLGLLYLGITGFFLEAFRLYLRNQGPWTVVAFVGTPLSIALSRSGIGPQDAVMVYQVLWWSHALVTFGLVASLPYTSLSHILTSSLNVMVAPEGPRGAMNTPFNLLQVMESGETDVKVGLKNYSDLTWRHRLQLEACTNCGRCESVCPATASGTPLSPRRIVQNMDRGLRTGLSKRRLDSPILSAEVTDQEVFSCTFCGACVEACPVLISPLEFIWELKRTITAEARLDKKMTNMLNNLGSYSNPYGLPISDRETLARELEAPTVVENPSFEYLYWVGCAATYDSRSRSVARAMVRIMKKAGVNFAILGGEERCSGDPARRMGEEGRFQELALGNIEVLKAHGVKKIVTHCPHCYNTLKNEYGELGGSFDVIHHTEFIDRLIREGRIRPSKEVRESVTLHDSCYVGRFNGVFEPPRRIIAEVSGARLVEMNRIKQNSFCCGAGGNNYWYDVPRKERISVIRAKEAAETGAQTLAVECPYCLQMFGDGLKVAGLDEKMKVKDVAEIVADSL